MIIKINNKFLEFGKKTLIMGIVNMTPDSFSDGGDYNCLDLAFERAKQMVEDGADILDIGGQSTRSGYIEVSLEEELNRVIPIVKKISEELDVLISVDTYRPQVAEAALKSGAHIINDIWGLQRDEKMAEVISNYDAAVVIMHNQEGTIYKDDIIYQMKEFFNKSIQIALQNNISKDKIIIDPGIGFGKTFEQNIEVLYRMKELRDIAPILLGTSRKSIVGNILNLPPKERVEGTIATNIIGIERGAEIVRVHDIIPNKRAIVVADKILRK